MLRWRWGRCCPGCHRPSTPPHPGQRAPCPPDGAPTPPRGWGSGPTGPSQGGASAALVLVPSSSLSVQLEGIRKSTSMLGAWCLQARGGGTVVAGGSDKTISSTVRERTGCCPMCRLRPRGGRPSENSGWAPGLAPLPPIPGNQGGPEGVEGRGWGSWWSLGWAWGQGTRCVCGTMAPQVPGGSRSSQSRCWGPAGGACLPLDDGDDSVGSLHSGLIFVG